MMLVGLKIRHRSLMLLAGFRSVIVVAINVVKYSVSARVYTDLRGFHLKISLLMVFMFRMNGMLKMDAYRK